ncbi:MAG: hypothetical protein SVX28_07245 [Pseudomonadota bacterium]|nr:hypothetical protein [Pseudomonadota bacterium]
MAQSAIKQIDIDERRELGDEDVLEVLGRVDMGHLSNRVRAALASVAGCKEVVFQGLERLWHFHRQQFQGGL